jgi:hypothetical protein
MPSHRFPVDIDIPTTESAAVRALGDRSLEDALPILAGIAIREWLEWLVADDRPASLTEVSKRRVKALVDGGLLPKIPTAPVIAQRTKLTLGQARYIVSSLALEDRTAGGAIRDGLAGRLRIAIEAVGIADPDNLSADRIREISVSDDDVVFDAPRAEGDLASATHEELLNAQFSDSKRLEIDAFPPPTKRRRTDSYVQLVLRPHVAVQILQRLVKAGES